MKTLWDFTPKASSDLPEPNVWDCVAESLHFGAKPWEGTHPFLMVKFAPLPRCWYTEWMK